MRRSSELRHVAIEHRGGRLWWRAIAHDRTIIAEDERGSEDRIDLEKEITRRFGVAAPIKDMTL